MAAGGFCLLFVFIGVFSHVNFELSGTRFGVSMKTLGAVHLVFLPSIFITPQAGNVADRFGVRRAARAGIGLALFGVTLMLLDWLPAMLAGMALVAVGTFLAQALATGFVSRAAMGDRAAASGLYFASYFSGGWAGAVILGQVYTAYGWDALSSCVAFVPVGAAFLARDFEMPKAA